jgi:hypothetical protein
LQVVIEGDEKGWRNFSCSEIGDVFACTTTTSNRINKRRVQAYLAHQTGLKTTIHAVLIIVESGDTGGWKSWRNFSPLGIGDVFACITTTSDPINKRMAQAYSAHQIGLKPTLHALLIAGCWCFIRWWRNFGRNFLPSDFGDVLATPATTSRAMSKWMLWLDSAGQKGLEITLEGILIVVEGWFTAERNGSPIGLGQNTHGSCLSTHIPQIA